jgi:hypothetical protein
MLSKYYYDNFKIAVYCSINNFRQRVVCNSSMITSKFQSISVLTTFGSG